MNRKQAIAKLFRQFENKEQHFISIDGDGYEHKHDKSWVCFSDLHVYPSNEFTTAESLAVSECASDIIRTLQDELSEKSAYELTYEYLLHATDNVPDDLDECADRFAEGGTVYTYDQLQWLAESTNHLDLMDEYMHELGGDSTSAHDAVTGAMYFGRLRAAHAVNGAINKLIDGDI